MATHVKYWVTRKLRSVLHSGKIETCKQLFSIQVLLPPSSWVPLLALLKPCVLPIIFCCFHWWQKCTWAAEIQMTVSGNKELSESLCCHQVVIWMFTTQKWEPYYNLWPSSSLSPTQAPFRVDAGMWFVWYFSKCPCSTMKASYKENKDMF